MIVIQFVTAAFNRLWGLLYFLSSLPFRALWAITFWKYRELNTNSRVKVLRVDLLQLREADEPERTKLGELLDSVDDLPNDNAEKCGIEAYVRKQLFLAVGPGQILFPFLGIAIVAYLLPALALYNLRQNVADFEPLGLGVGLFMWILIAGTSGGVIRVLRDSLGRQQESRTALGLFFVGVLRPIIGMVLAVVLTSGFISGFIAFPVENLAEQGVLGSWPKGDAFLVLGAFVAGFAEGIVMGAISQLGR